MIVMVFINCHELAKIKAELLAKVTFSKENIVNPRIKAAE